MYLQILCRAHWQRKHWVLDLFREWDAVLFPLLESKLGGKPRNGGEEELRQIELHQALDTGDDLSAEESEPSDKGLGKGGSEPEGENWN